MAIQKNAGNFKISVKFSKKPTETLELRVFLFDKKRGFIENTIVKNDEALFKTKVKTKDDVLLLVVPNKKGIEGITNYQVLLSKYKAYKPVIRLNSKRKFEILPIPDRFIPAWFIRKCSVTGNVSKFFDISGFFEKKGLCNVRVHICEVDKISWLIPRIPDDIIIRIPDLMIHPKIPIPVPVFPDPPIPPLPDPPIPPRFGNIKNIETNFSAASFRQPKIDIKLEESKLDLTKTIQPVLSNTDILRSLKSKNPVLIRDTILANFHLFHPIFCNIPWLWPYFYKCDELAMVYTDNNGDFDADIYYSLLGDHPDLYFWVEALVDDVWTTVYKPSIPCHTYWNYACGTDVNITVTDPRVRWECTETLNGELIWVKTIRYGTSVSHIQQYNVTGTSIQGMSLNRQGLTDKHESIGNFRRPFGSNLFFMLQFSNELPSNKYTYYRWSYRKLKNADLSNASGTIQQIVNLVNKTYSFVFIGTDGHFHFGLNKMKLGPFDKGTGTGLYLIPTASPTSAPFNATEAEAKWDGNTRSVYFDSASLDGDGLYEFILELFDKNGNKVADIPNELFQVPNYSTFAPSIDALPINLNSSGVNTSNAFKMVMRIDNSLCEADIYKIKVDGIEANPTCCGFVPYKNTSNIEIAFRAYHPQNFADLSFTVQKGTCNDSTQTGKTNATGMVIGNASTNDGIGYIRNGFSEYTRIFTPADLLGICTSEGKAAYAEYLYVNALATNGDHEIDSYDVSKLAAFALEPE